MDYGYMVSDAFEYTREALIERWMRWLLLTIVSIIPIVNFISIGYMMEIIRGTKPASELENWADLFMEGLKLVIIWLIFMVPALVIFAIIGGNALLDFIISFLGIIASGDTRGIPSLVMGAIASLMGAVFIAGIVTLVIDIIAAIGVIRFTRTGSIGEAFNFSAILETIGRIGWVEYIIALVILYIVGVIVKFVVLLLSAIPVLGWIIGFFISAALIIFEGRYLALIYDST